MRLAFWQVDAIRADPRGQPVVGPYQQDQPALAREAAKRFALRRCIGRAERPEHYRRPARQPGRRRRIGGPPRVGEEQQWRQPLSPVGAAP